MSVNVRIRLTERPLFTLIVYASLSGQARQCLLKRANEAYGCSLSKLLLIRFVMNLVVKCFCTGMSDFGELSEKWWKAIPVNPYNRLSIRQKTEQSARLAILKEMRQMIPNPGQP